MLGAVVKNARVPDDRSVDACFLVEKLDKIGAAEVQKKKDLTESVGLSADVVKRITDATAAKTLDDFAQLADVGDSPEVKELRKRFGMAEDYGYGDWLMFDASVVRGVAYYTGVVCQGFDREAMIPEQLPPRETKTCFAFAKWAFM